MRRRHQHALALLVLVALTTACAHDGERPEGDGEPDRKRADSPGSQEPGPDTLVVGAQADAESFISVVYQSANDGRFIDAMFLPLTGTDFDCRIIAPPLLAERYDHPDDGLSITYYIRKDIQWSDGVPVTAKDVAFTYDLIADPKVASPRFAYIEHMKPDARPRVLDEHTVRFEFTHAYDRQSQIAHTGLNILPEHVLSKYDRASLRGTDFDKAPVVSGWWTIGKWDKGSTLVLVPNEKYTGPTPAKLGRAIFKVIPEYATRLIELESGSIDMLESFQNMEDIVRIKKTHPEIVLYRRGWRFMDYVAWNLKDPLFAEKEVRQALTMAIDREKLVKDLLTTSDGEVLGRVATSWITPELCDYRSDAITPFPHDPERAKRILAEHGWKDSDGDGVLDKDGKPFHFTLITNSGNARRAKATIIVQANLKDVGVDCEIAYVESNNFFERTRKKDFEAALSGWSAGLFVDPTDLWHCDEGEKKYEFNFPSYCNPRADELMEQGLRTPALEDQIPIWQELQAIIHDDQPYTYLYWRDEVVGLHERFKGANVDILSEVHDLHEWWVPKDRVKYAR